MKNQWLGSSPWDDVLLFSDGHCGEVRTAADWKTATPIKQRRVVGLVDADGPVIRWADEEAKPPQASKARRFFWHTDFLCAGDDITRVRKGLVLVGPTSAPRISW